MINRRKTTGGAAAAVRVRTWRRVNLVVVANVTLASMVLCLFVGYLAMNNRTATKGFAIKAAEERLSELREQGQKLDLEMVSVQAMENIDAHVSGLGFVPVDQVDYISGGPAVVAVK